MIIFKRDALGIRTDMHFIPYENIVSFRLIKGFFFSSIKLRLLGAVRPNDEVVTGQDDDETQIRGLTKADANALAQKISQKINESKNKQKEVEKTIVKHSTPVINLFFNTNIITPKTMLPGMYLPASIYNEPKFTDNDISGEVNQGETAARSENAEMAEEEAPDGNEIYETQKEIEINEIKRDKNSTHAGDGGKPKEVNPNDLLIFKAKQNNRQTIFGSLSFLDQLFPKEEK